MEALEAFFWNFVRQALRGGQLDWCMHHRLLRMYDALPDLQRDPPRRILQIGRGEGGGELLLSLLYPGAVVYSIDNEQVARPLPHTLKVIESLGLRCMAHVGDSADEESIAFARSHQPYDLLIIDGDHGGDYPLEDFLRYAPMTRGYAVFDDYNPHFPDVFRAVERIALHYTTVLKDPQTGLAIFVV